jgi:hypothetical protein
MAAAAAALVRMVESGPIPAVHGVVHWRLDEISASCVQSLPQIGFAMLPSFAAGMVGAIEMCRG